MKTSVLVQLLKPNGHDLKIVISLQEIPVKLFLYVYTVMCMFMCWGQGGGHWPK